MAGANRVGVDSKRSAQQAKPAYAGNRFYFGAEIFMLEYFRHLSIILLVIKKDANNGKKSIT